VDQIPNFGDSRQMVSCVFCGGPVETRDHVPSKVFLDEPYPTNLPIVPSCKLCNSGFSLDEEYVACLVECVLAGSTDPRLVKRKKIKRILEKKPALASKLSDARQETESGTIFTIEMERVRNVVLKLARGHAAFELNEPQLDNPSDISFLPFPSMNPAIREIFEGSPGSSGPLLAWPEVGSRAMQRLVEGLPEDSSWIIAQPGRYRYITSVDGSAIVRIVISEYLACQVEWA